MIDLTKLPRALRKSSRVRWIRKNSKNIIMTDYFILETDKEVKGAALTTLITILGRKPGEGEGLEEYLGTRCGMSEKDIEFTMELLKPRVDKKLTYTELTYEASELSMTIFEVDKNYVYVNKIYTDLVNLYIPKAEMYGRDSMSPVYIETENEKIMITPIRLVENPSYLKVKTVNFW
jgi:hypothetical protein